MSSCEFGTKPYAKKTQTDGAKNRTFHSSLRAVKTEMLRSNSPVKVRGESLWWERFVKEVGFDPGVEERGSYGWWEW